MPKAKGEKKATEKVKVKNTIWNLSEAQRSIFLMLDESGGEITPEIETAIAVKETNELNRVFTLKAILTMCKDKAALAKQKKAEFAEIQKSYENHVSNIKRWLADFLIKSGKKSLELDLESVSLRKTPDRVEVDDVAEIPDQYKKYAVTLNHAQYQALKMDCEFNELTVPIGVVSIDKAGIKAEYKVSKLEAKGTHIESGFTVTVKG